MQSGLHLEVPEPAAKAATRFVQLPVANSTPLTEGLEAPRLDFASLHEFMQTIAADNSRCYAPGPELQLIFRRALENCEVVSFDIFDTALIRYVDHPADVFFHLDQQAAFTSHSFAAPVSRLRIQAENKAREMVHTILGTMEVNLLEIYQVFCDLNGIGRAWAPSFCEAEEQVEMHLCTASPIIYDLYREAVARSKKIIFVSDTYHRRSFLLSLLRAKNYAVEEDSLFTSSEARKSKQSGDLFPHVLSALSLKPEGIVHVGDHPVSDDVCARKAGINAILHPYRASREHTALVLANGAAQGGYDQLLAQQSFVRGMVRATTHAAQAAGRGDDFWWKFGYASAGPMIVGASQWLERELRADGIEHAYFMLRDGLLWRRVYEELFAQDANPCSTSTLFTSRRAMLLPVFEIAPTFSLISMFAGIGLRPVREYVDRLHLPSANFEAEGLIAGFTSLDEEIDGRRETRRLLRFLMQPRVLEALVERSRYEGVYLKRYLAQEGVLSKKRMAFIDLGWTGTVHKCLHLLLSKLNPEAQAIGYYLATSPEASYAIVPNLEVRSYLTHRGQPQSMHEKIHLFTSLFEFTFSSTEGSLLHFAEESACGLEAEAAHKMIPVLQANDRSEAECRHLASLHEGALAFASDFKRASKGLSMPPIPPEIASEQFLRVVQQPTHEEAIVLGEILYCDNLGSSSKHVAARLQAGATPAQLLQAFMEAPWKQGLLAIKTAEGAALRTLLWLQSSKNEN